MAVAVATVWRERVRARARLWPGAERRGHTTAATSLRPGTAAAGSFSTSDFKTKNVGLMVKLDYCRYCLMCCLLNDVANYE